MGSKNKCLMRVMLWTAWITIKNQDVKINMGNDQNLKPIFMSTKFNLKRTAKSNWTHLGIYERLYIDLWRHVPRLDPKITQHRLNIKPNVKPAKQ